MGSSMARPILAALDVLGRRFRPDANRRLRRAQLDSLARARFQDGKGHWRNGDSLQVLRPGRPLAECLGEDDLSAAFWYCEADDGALFLAIAVDYRLWHGWRVEWVIRSAMEPSVELQQQAQALVRR